MDEIIINIEKLLFLLKASKIISCAQSCLLISNNFLMSVFTQGTF